jgi:dTMP kinase
MTARKGYLITLEGGEGSGKSTVGESLHQHPNSLGLKVKYFREPGSTSIGEQVRKVLKDAGNEEMSDRTEALLFQAARAQFCEEVLWPCLEEGCIVVSDRFYDSSEVYQGEVRGLGRERIRDLNLWSTKGLVPDLTILFDVSTEKGLERKGKKIIEDRLDSLGLDFHKKVRETYLTLAREDSNDRWIVVDADRELQEVENDVISITEGRLIREGYIEKLQGRLERR